MFFLLFLLFHEELVSNINDFEKSNYWRDSYLLSYIYIHVCGETYKHLSKSVHLILM